VSGGRERAYSAKAAGRQFLYGACRLSGRYYISAFSNTERPMGTRVTVKGQVTIPKSVREAAGIKPGDSVEFIVDATGRVMLQRERTSRHRLQEVLERIRRDPPIRGLSAEEIMAMTRGEE
jgi:antitoxin PrlF